jgi:Ca2+-transporting ATPase
MARNIFVVGFIFVIVQVVLLLWMNGDGALSRYEQSEFFTFFAMLQFWNMFNAKAYLSGSSAFKGLWENKSFISVCLIIVIGQFLIVTFGGKMFNVMPLSLDSWLKIIVSTSLVLWVGEIVRLAGAKK